MFVSVTQSMDFGEHRLSAPCFQNNLISAIWTYSRACGPQPPSPAPNFTAKGSFVYLLVTLSPTPTPLMTLLLQTKTKVKFDWTVDRAVEAFLGLLLTSNCASDFRPS